MDIQVIRRIYDQFGPAVDLLVDVKNMYNIQDTQDFLIGISEVPVYWIEEPVVEQPDVVRQLKSWMNANGREETLYADGERPPEPNVHIIW